MLNSVDTLAFVGSLMPHHRPDVLIEALEVFSVWRNVELHLIGSKLSSVVDALQSVLEVTNHGFFERKQLGCILETLDIGLIAGVVEYQSLMKLFDYGSTRIAVVAPDTHHLKSWYPEELQFFNSGDANALVRALVLLDRDRDRMSALGNSLHERILGSFTWDRVFASKANVIKSVCELR